MGDIAQQLRLFFEADLDAVEQLYNGADPLLLARRRAAWTRVELLQGFIQSQLAALQTLLVVLQLQQRVLGHRVTIVTHFKSLSESAAICAVCLTCSSVNCAGRSGVELTNSRGLLLLP